MNDQVIDNVAQHRFELGLSDGELAAAYYQVDPEGRVVILHTEVPFALSGRGYATRLASGTFDLIRKSGRKVILKCPFMSAFFGKHPEYGDIVAG